jgi:hypothetical protein
MNPLEVMVELYRGYFDHFEGRYYSPIHRDRARRKFVKYALEVRPSHQTFIEWVGYHHYKPSKDTINKYMRCENGRMETI